jgi:hypothetical protein
MGAEQARVTITIDETRSVSGLLQVPANATSCFVLAYPVDADTH